MSLEIGYVLVLLVAALALFAIDYFSVDVAALLVLLALAVPGVLEPEEALRGFGSDTIIVIASLFVLTAGVTRTGVVERLGLRLATFGGASPTGIVRLLLVSATTISGFISNTVTCAVFLPLTIGTARRAKVPIAKVLMPLAFATILSGGITLVSTSTNLVVSGELPRYGLEPIGFFELAPVGIGITVLGMLYLLFVAPRLVPDRRKGERVETYGLRRYMSEVLITPDSKLVGKTLAESRMGDAMDLHVIGIRRGETRTLVPKLSTVLKPADVLLIEGRADDILLVKDAVGIEIRPDFRLSDPDLESDSVRMVEAMVIPGSELARKSLRELALRESRGLTVLAIHSPGRNVEAWSRLSSRRLRAGDVLLLQGRVEDIERIDLRELLPLEDVSSHHPRSVKGRIASAIFVATLAIGALGILPLSIAFLTGAVVLVVTRCLTPAEAYESIDWRLMVLIGAMLAFGTAIEKTGTSGFLSELVVEHLSPLGGRAVLAGFFLLTVILTQPMSNQAAAIVVLPVAIEVARAIGIDPRSLVMGVTFAASCSFLTPLEPACILVYGPGRYRFFDFFKVGLPLTVIVFVFCMVLIPLVWPLQPGN